MKKIQTFINKYLKLNLINKRKKVENKVLFVQENENVFKKRKKQLSLNLNRINNFSLNQKNKYIIITSIVFLGVFLVIFVLFWPYFKIDKINIMKKDDITNLNIAYKWVENLRWELIFNAEKNNILDKLTTYQQNIKDIDINISLPNTLKIMTESYKWLFNTSIKNWKTEKKYILVENWTLVPTEIQNKELKNMQIINNNWQTNNFIDYKQIYEEKYIKNIDYLAKKIEENIINIKIKNIIYYPIEREVHFKIENNLLIYSLDEDIDKQIEKTVIFNKQHFELNKPWIYYTDLRIPNKIFYCSMEFEYKCKENIKRIYEK